MNSGGVLRGSQKKRSSGDDSTQASGAKICHIRISSRIQAPV
jgi:hypothetical protein